MNQRVSNVEFVGYPGEFMSQPIPFVQAGVSAGFPSPADDYIDRALDLNELLVTNPPATFFVRVDGDSMIDAGIHHGDILSVDRSEEAFDGSIVIAMVNGEMTVKELSLYPELRLIAHNEKYPPIELKEHDEFEIFGRVKGLVRVFK